MVTQDSYELTCQLGVDSPITRHKTWRQDILHKAMTINLSRPFERIEIVNHKINFVYKITNIKIVAVQLAY